MTLFKANKLRSLIAKLGFGIGSVRPYKPNYLSILAAALLIVPAGVLAVSSPVQPQASNNEINEQQQNDGLGETNEMSSDVSTESTVSVQSAAPGNSNEPPTNSIEIQVNGEKVSVPPGESVNKVINSPDGSSQTVISANNNQNGSGSSYTHSFSNSVTTSTSTSGGTSISVQHNNSD